MSETLSESEMNEIEGKIVFCERYRDAEMVLPVRIARALYDLARRAPLPTVDASLDELEGLIKEGKAT